MHRSIRAILVAMTVAVLSTGCMTAVAAFQPEVGDVIVVTTLDAEGVAYDRVVSPIDEGEQLYVSVNHWPRAWYRRALANPEVRVTRGGETREYRVVHLEGEQHDAFLARHPRSLLVSAMMGFAPREILRFDPR